MILIKAAIFRLPSEFWYIAQWFERLTRDEKVAGLIPIWGSETFF